MLNLQVETSSGTYLLDLYENDPIELNYRFTDISEVNKSVGSFSKSFRIPATEHNIACFGFMYSTNEVGGYNPKVKSDAVLSFNTMPLMNGFVQFKKAYIQKEVYSDFEIVFFGEAVNLARTLGDSKLKDLELSAYDHEINYTNLTNSWSGTLFSGAVRYGLIDKGQQFGVDTLINSSNPITPALFTPFVEVNTLVEEIFSQNGFELDSTFLTTSNNFYTPFWKGGDGTEVDINFALSTANVGLTSDQTITINGFPETYIIPNFSESTPYFDTGSNFDPSSSEYTAPEDGTYSIIYNVGVDWSATGSESASVSVVLRNVTDGFNVYSSPSEIVPDGADFFFQDTIQVNLESGKDYAFAVNVTASGGSIDILSNANQNSAFGTWFWIYDLAQPAGTLDVDLSVNAPDIKQIDFLTGLQKMFNLVFVPDRNNPKKITVEPFNDFTADNAKDWTKLLDYDKDVVIYPTTDIQRKEYEFTYSPDKDFLNKFYQDNANRVYGRWLIEDVNNDFATGTLKVQPKFGAYPLQLVDGTNLLIHKGYDADGVAIKDPLCKVVFWGGLQDANGFWVNNGGTAVEESEYPYFGHYDVPNPTVLDNDLNFGSEQATYPITANPSNNLYTTYWRQYTEELYSSNSRILEGYFKLNPSDISQFRFDDRIFIKDSYWRILELKNVPNDRSLSFVKLIKILSGVRSCEWLPTGITDEGKIIMTDSNGVTGDGTQECCEANGYNWIAGACYQQNVNPIDGLPHSHLVNGLRVATDSSGEERNFLQGRNLTSEFTDVQLFGQNGVAIAQGWHRSAGWWHENFGIGNEINQIGKLTFVYEGDFDNGDSAELFIDGVKNNRLNILDDSAMGVNFKVSVITYNSASSDIAEAQFLQFNEVLLKKNKIASTYNGASSFNPDVNVGTLSTTVGDFTMTIDTATDTNQHRVKVSNTAVSNTNKTKIICEASYSMARM